MLKTIRIWTSRLSHSFTKQSTVQITGKNPHFTIVLKINRSPVHHLHSKSFLGRFKGGHNRSTPISRGVLLARIFLNLLVGGLAGLCGLDDAGAVAQHAILSRFSRLRFGLLPNGCFEGPGGLLNIQRYYLMKKRVIKNIKKKAIELDSLKCIYWLVWAAPATKSVPRDDESNLLLIRF